MIPSLPQPAASSSSAAVETPHPLLAVYEDIALKQDIALAPALLLELHAFLRRNRILGDATATPIAPEEDVCLDCLKAHTLAHAAVHDVTALQRRALQKHLPGAIGHKGWYLDGSALKRG